MAARVDQPLVAGRQGEPPDHPANPKEPPVRAALVGLLFGLTAAYPALALLLWHTALAVAGVAGTGAGWALGQPAVILTLAAVFGWRQLVRTGRRQAA